MDTLPEILERYGKSASDISKKSGIALARINDLVGGAEPSLAELREVASALGVSPSEFQPRSGRSRQTELLFRQTMGDYRPSQVAEVELLSEKIERSLELIPPTVDLDWLKRFEGSHSTFDDAVRDGDTFREVFFNGDMLEPLLGLPSIAVDKVGVILTILRQSRIDGASAVINGIPFVFVSPRFPPRMLFTVAHELGHIVAHHMSGNSFAWFDSNTGGIRQPRRQVERYADAFASNLLLPMAGVGIALRKIREIHQVHQDAVGDIEILYLGRLFGVSFQVAARRCEDLGLLPSGGALSLFDEIRKEFGSPEKRAEQLGLPARPEIIFPTLPRQVLEGAIRKVRAGEVSIGRASESLSVPMELIMEIHRRMTIDHSI